MKTGSPLSSLFECRYVATIQTHESAIGGFLTAMRSFPIVLSECLIFLNQRFDLLRGEILGVDVFN